MRKNLLNYSFIAILSLLLQSCSTQSDSAQPRHSVAYPSYDMAMMLPNTNGENDTDFISTSDQNTSTFSIDVDVASYSHIRSIINDGQLPQAEHVRIEEMINYFNYDHPQPEGEHPFSLNDDAGQCPWNKDNKLIMLNINAKKIADEKIPASNLVFLLDVSGSMSAPDKLPLLKSSIKLLVDKMRPKDKIAIVVYAGAAGLVLPSTSGDQKQKILKALDQLEAGGSTAGGEGLHLAYKVAQENMIKGNNRVILATDGDFNVGPSSDEEMIKLIEEKRKTGVYMTALGFGRGFNDSKLEKIADHGNGNYAFIDTFNEAKKVLIKEFGGTILTLANDVKIQVVFDAEVVQKYRLIGYKNRRLNNEDFEDDQKDAGELGSGQSVTAFYEVILQPDAPKKAALLYKTRYKLPNQSTSIEFDKSVFANFSKEPSQNFNWAAAVAQFGMILSKESSIKDASFESILDLANKAKGADLNGYRAEFIELVGKAQKLQ